MVPSTHNYPRWNLNPIFYLKLSGQLELAIQKSNHFEEDLELLARLFRFMNLS